MSVGVTFPALASLLRLRPTTGARACLPGISVKETTGTLRSMA